MKIDQVIDVGKNYPIFSKIGSQKENLNNSANFEAIGPILVLNCQKCLSTNIQCLTKLIQTLMWKFLCLGTMCPPHAGAHPPGAMSERVKGPDHYLFLNWQNIPNFPNFKKQKKLDIILRGMYCENPEFLSLNTTLTIAVQNSIIKTKRFS